jgi:hypothetical protein
MRRLILILTIILLAGSAFAADKLQIMESGKIKLEYLPTTDFSVETDPASPEDGQIWWNETEKLLKIADTNGVYSFNGTLTAWDTTPTAFSFIDVVNATTNSTYTSDPITVAGINHPAPISVSGDASAKYSVNNATATAVNGTVAAGDEVRAVVTSSAEAATAVNATVLIGGVSDAWSVTTAAVEEEPEPQEVVCNGTIINGDNESFEKGDGEFCTTGWTITASSGVDTYDDYWGNTGEHSLSLTDSSSSSEPHINTYFGTTTTTKYVRFYVNTTDIVAESTFSIGSFGKYATSGTTIGNITIKDVSSGGTERRILPSVAATEYFVFTDGDILRVEACGNDVGSSTSLTLRVYRKNGGEWVQLVSNVSNSEIVFNAVSDSLRYFNFYGASTSASPSVLYIDDVKFGDSWIG